ncbi:hypothetical protein HYPSUDRAFT_1091883 [Hypholoma sublateritium FD-334 SS-4]|uniref:HNH nuclease domain-containing protein n=1 Tax=Hypholoma sublateritium (strain FD-334 SS-4) TaxID=945553 RepID=A0A0D2PI50_HYPSF|nr:hypothetical protein HYPSUDRAFT_1091883 [Hypholoma sublateritium FD-334 SS-4]
MATPNDLSPRALPRNSYNRSAQAPLHDAYEDCLMMEASASGEVVAREIVACHANFDRMRSLSRFYIDHLTRLYVEPAPTSHQAAKKSALRRDGYSCVVTGRPDRTSVQSMQPADLQKYKLDDNSVYTSTNHCHIFPPSTNRFDQNGPAEKKKKYAESVWSIIENSSHIDMLSELNFENIHHLQNGFMMHSQLHTLFFCLLKPRDYVSFYLPANHTITFTSTDPCLPLPNPGYLRLHAAIYLEDRKVKNLGVLARDGSSADLLTSRLTHLVFVE